MNRSGEDNLRGIPAPGPAPSPQPASTNPNDVQDSGTDLQGREPLSDSEPGQSESEVDSRQGSERLRKARGVSALERELLSQAKSVEESSIAPLTEEVNGLRRLLKVTRQISSILDPDQLQEVILDEAISLTSAERGLILLREGAGLQVVLGRGRDQASLAAETSRVSETLARRCMEENRIMTYDNFSQMPQLREIQSIKALRLYSALCLPLLSQGTPFGVLYLDSSRPGTLRGPRELELLEAFASQAAISLVNARLMKDLDDSRVKLQRENEDLRASARAGPRYGNLLGESRVMQDLFERIRLLKDVDIPIVIQGESGTGKELVARALHYEGRRQGGPFVAINCAALPGELLESTLFGHRKGAFTGAAEDRPGLVEQADGGSLFLDEVGDMPLPLQVKLLRFLENGEFRRVGDGKLRTASARVLSATNRDLRSMIRTKQFRDDLYFRLEGVRIEVPPLRERREDLPILIEHYLAEAATKTHRPIPELTPAAYRMLLEYAWPGNVRQLIRAIEGACALIPPGGRLDEAQLRVHLMNMDGTEATPRSATGAEKLEVSLSRSERTCLETSLQRHAWNITRAAKDLGISRQHLHNRIRLHGLKRPQSPPSQI